MRIEVIPSDVRFPLVLAASPSLAEQVTFNDSLTGLFRSLEDVMPISSTSIKHRGNELAAATRFLPKGCLRLSHCM
jgi:hypothetical protein